MKWWILQWELQIEMTTIQQQNAAQYSVVLCGMALVDYANYVVHE